MDPPADGMGLQPEKLEEEKEGGPLFHCDLCDADIVYKIAQSFLPGLASACIDNTTGGLFKTPANVAVDIRREMVDYLIQRSENFVAESVVLEGGPDVEASIDPYDIISDFVDDFISSKRNFFSRVSGWLLSDRREDWIDDFVQEIEVNGFWLLNRRNTVAQTLLKNLDFKNVYHCKMNFKSLEDLEQHKSGCSFRIMTCSNEGCDTSFSAAQMDQHDSTCPFKMLQCEQNCPDIVMRREMDRHCITTCPMKLVKCPFYSVGCHSTVPQCTIEQHRIENLSGHLLCILQVVHKEATSLEDLKGRASELEKLSSPGRLESARDARSLAFAIKDLEIKLGPVEGKAIAKCDEEEEKADKPPSEKEATVDSHSNSSSDHEDSSNRGNRESTEPSTTSSAPLQQTNVKEVDTSICVQENLEESPVQVQGEGLGSPERVDEKDKEEVVDPVIEENTTSPVELDNLTEEVSEKEKHAESSTNENEVFTESPPVKNEISIDSPPGDVSSSATTTVESEMPIESPHEEERMESVNREVGKEESTPGKEETDDSLNSTDKN